MNAWARRALQAALLGVLALSQGCGRRTCQETSANLEPLGDALRERLSASVNALYYGGPEYRGRVAQVEVVAHGVQESASYRDEHWRGSAPRLVVRAGPEVTRQLLSLATPGWDRDELEALLGRRLLVVVYVPRRFVPPLVGHPAEVGRALYVCD